MKFCIGDRVLVNWEWEGTVVDMTADKRLVKVRFWWFPACWYSSSNLDLIRSAK
jgi:hypothetical protein